MTTCNIIAVTKYKTGILKDVKMKLKDLLIYIYSYIHNNISFQINCSHKFIFNYIIITVLDIFFIFVVNHENQHGVYQKK